MESRRSPLLNCVARSPLMLATLSRAHVRACLRGPRALRGVRNGRGKCGSSATIGPTVVGTRRRARADREGGLNWASPQVNEGSLLPRAPGNCVSNSARRWKGTVTMGMVGAESGRALFTLLAACAAIGQVLESRTKWGGRISGPLLAMATGVLLSGIGAIPSSSPTYDMIFSTVLPLAAALTLLENNVWQAFGDAGSTLQAFCFGAIGTVLGTVVAFRVVGRSLGAEGWKIASSLCSSYVGGSINYAATAQVVGLNSASLLAAGMAADNLAMGLYFGIIMSIPDDVKQPGTMSKGSNVKSEVSAEGRVAASAESLVVSLAAATAACAAGDALAGILPSSFAGSGLALMAMVASLINAVAAKLWCAGASHGVVPIFAGSQDLGQALMLVFFAAVGASTGLRQAVAGGWPLVLFICILIFVHLGTILLLGRWARLPMRSILIASNANIGGPGTAAAMANSRSWHGLIRPALLVGTLGYTIGTAIGSVVGIHLLQPMF